MTTRTLARPLDPDTSRILSYAARWYRWGGGRAEDIFVEFGISPDTFCRRVLALTETADLDPYLRIDIRCAYAHRLQLARRRRPPRAGR